MRYLIALLAALGCLLWASPVQADGGGTNWRIYGTCYVSCPGGYTGAYGYSCSIEVSWWDIASSSWKSTTKITYITLADGTFHCDFGIGTDVPSGNTGGANAVVTEVWDNNGNICQFSGGANAGGTWASGTPPTDYYTFTSTENPTLSDTYVVHN